MNNEVNFAILNEIRKMARNLPGGYARAISNRCDRVQMLMSKGREFKNPVPENEAEHFDTQAKRAYAYMLAGNTLTSLEALRLFGIISFPRRIKDIEKMTGNAPKRERIQVVNKYGKTVSVNKYWIEKEGE